MKGVLYSVKNVISEYGSDTEGICFVSSDRAFIDTLLTIRDEIENVNNYLDIKRKGVINFDDIEQRGFRIAFPVEDQLKWIGCKAEPLIHNDGYSIMKIDFENSKCTTIIKQHGTMIAYKKLGEANLPHAIDSWLLIK